LALDHLGFKALPIVIQETSSQNLGTPVTGCCTEGFNLPQIGGADEHGHQSDNNWVFSQPDGFRRLQSSCKNLLLPESLSPFALGLGSTPALAFRPGAERLAL